MKLLLAEDEKSLSKAIVTILTKNCYSVDAVYNGEDALAYLQCGYYDGVILDVMMPKMDGLTVLKHMRKAGMTSPVLILSAKSEIDDKVEGLDLGANDYLTKPFAARELVARIRAMTRNQVEQPDNRLVAGNLTLNPANAELTSPFGSFSLTNKEYQLIELLIRHLGQVITIDQLMERIWGIDSDVESNVVWTYISYLRKKLEVLQADVEIKVKRNIGYMLINKGK